MKIAEIKEVLKNAPYDASHFDTGEKCYLKAVGDTLYYRFNGIGRWLSSNHKDGVNALTMYDYCVSLESMKEQVKSDLNIQLHDLVVKGQSVILAPDYCNDFGLTMELAVKHDISIIRFDDGWLAFNREFDYIDTSRHETVSEGITIGGDHMFCASDKEPLVAIVKCLIQELK